MTMLLIAAVPWLLLGAKVQVEAQRADPRAEPGTDCWYENYCKDNGENQIKTIKDIPTPEECYAKCVDEVTCKHFSWKTTYMGVKQCVLLSGVCEEIECSDKPSCVSGPQDCAPVEPCAKLVYLAGDVVWSCDNFLNPYKSNIPSGYTCRTSCGSWTPALVQSKCDNGAWTEPIGALGVETPDKSTKCLCKDFSLWYNPNVEPGAAFYCTITPDFSLASEENPVTLEQDDECILICDNSLVADIICVNGKWTDADPERGIACYKAPPTTTTTLAP